MLRSYFSPTHCEAGCDEVGRGCLAGPVVAAAVILPKDFVHPLLNDSKQLTSSQRELLRPVIQRGSVAWSLGMASPQEIDQINILRATHLAIHRAIAQLRLSPSLLLIDGNNFTPYSPIPHHCIVKGDTQFASIAAASVLAKTYRDAHMRQLAQSFPGYGWERNVGYPTQVHRQAIQQLGITPNHRHSFRLLAAGKH